MLGTGSSTQLVVSTVFFQAGSNDGNTDSIFAHALVFGSTKFAFHFRVCILVDDTHNLVELRHFQATRSSGNVYQYTACTIQSNVIQERAGDSLVGSQASTVDTLCETRTHHGDTAIAHHSFHVGEVQVDHVARTSHHFGNTGNRITQYIVGRTESFTHGHVFAQSSHQFVVRDNNQGINALFELIQTCLSDVYAFAFVSKRTGYNRNGQDTHFFSDFSHNRSGAGTCTTTHTGSDEQHVCTADGIFDGFAIFLSSGAADFRICTGTQTSSQVCTQLNAFSRIVFSQ